jgi:glutathione S-transferase
MRFELISFPTCPFVQRAVIVLLEKNVPHQVRYVEDLDHPPKWFIKISPRERVPVLVVDGISLFESQAICEFLDEVTPEPKLMPENAILRARDRAWFAYAAEDLIFPAYEFAYAAHENSVKEAREQLEEKVNRLNSEMKNREYLSGDGKRFGMADIAMASFLYRAAWFARHGWLDLLSAFPNIHAWAKRVLSRPSVQNSVPEDFDQRSLSSMKEQGSWILTKNKL